MFNELEASEKAQERVGHRADVGFLLTLMYYCDTVEWADRPGRRSVTWNQLGWKIVACVSVRCYGTSAKRDVRPLSGHLDVTAL